MSLQTTSVWEAQLESILGEAGLLALENVFGGQYIHVHVCPRAELVAAIGPDAATALAYEYGGEDIYVPTKLKKLHRNRQIRRDSKNTGTKLEDLARKYRLSCQRIKDILREEHGYDG